MFKIKASDGIMKITMIPSFKEKLTEKEFERLVAEYVVFYSIAHNGTPPSSAKVQSYIADIMYDYNKED